MMLRILRSFGLAAVVTAAALVVTASAHAQVDGRDAEARALFQAGQVAFEEGRYENALEYFRRSHELSGRPELLYNVGSAADRLRMDADALRAFEQYLAARPDAPNRAEVEARIAVLRRAVAASAAAEEATTTATESGETTSEAGETTTTEPEPDPIATTPAPRDEGPGVAPWILVGAGAAVAVAGGVMVGVAASDVATVENAPMLSSWADVRDAYERSEPLSVAGFVMLGVGAAAAIGGVVWAVAGGSSSDESQPQAELLIGPGSVGVRGTF